MACFRDPGILSRENKIDVNNDGNDLNNRSDVDINVGNIGTSLGEQEGEDPQTHPEAVIQSELNYDEDEFNGSAELTRTRSAQANCKHIQVPRV